MSLGRFFKQLLGGDDAPTMSDDPFQRKSSAPPVAAPVAAPPPAPRTLVHRDEIIDSRSRICGYRFSPRSLAGAAAALPQAAVDALKAEGVVRFAERRLAVIPLGLEDWLAADFQQFCTANTVFLLDAPPLGAEPGAWLAGVEAMKAAGARLGLPGAALRPELDPALACADLVVIDSGDYSLQAFESLLRKLRQGHPELAIAADGVHSWPEQRMCLGLGARYCLGGFATSRDEEEQGDKLTQGRLVVLEMLNLLRRDAELGQLVDVAKRDPGVAVQVLSMANSPLSGLAQPVASLDQAIVVLGRQVLYRWLMVSMFRVGGGSGRDEALLELALCRARFLELVGQVNHAKQDSDALFLVGLLSLLDSLLGLPMAQVVARMNLPESVVDVLLRSEGPYGRYLMLALAMEKQHSEQVAKLAEALALPVATVEASSAAALAWAEEAIRAGR